MSVHGLSGPASSGGSGTGTFDYGAGVAPGSTPKDDKVSDDDDKGTRVGPDFESWRTMMDLIPIPIKVDLPNISSSDFSAWRGLGGVPDTPEMQWPSGYVPPVPNISSPDFSAWRNWSGVPDVDMPNIPSPDFSAWRNWSGVPDVDLPNISSPDFSAWRNLVPGVPDVDMPNISSPDFSAWRNVVPDMPNISSPDFSAWREWAGLPNVGINPGDFGWENIDITKYLEGLDIDIPDIPDIPDMPDLRDADLSALSDAFRQLMGVDIIDVPKIGDITDTLMSVLRRIPGLDSSALALLADTPGAILDVIKAVGGGVDDLGVFIENYLVKNHPDLYQNTTHDPYFTGERIKDELAEGGIEYDPTHMPNPYEEMERLRGDVNQRTDILVDPSDLITPAEGWVKTGPRVPKEWGHTLSDEEWEFAISGGVAPDGTTVEGRGRPGQQEILRLHGTAGVLEMNAFLTDEDDRGNKNFYQLVTPEQLEDADQAYLDGGIEGLQLWKDQIFANWHAEASTDPDRYYRNSDTEPEADPPDGFVRTLSALEELLNPSALPDLNDTWGNNAGANNPYIYGHGAGANAPDIRTGVDSSAPSYDDFFRSADEYESSEGINNMGVRINTSGTTDVAGDFFGEAVRPSGNQLTAAGEPGDMPWNLHYSSRRGGEHMWDLPAEVSTSAQEYIAKNDYRNLTLAQEDGKYVLRNNSGQKVGVYVREDGEWKWRKG